MELRRVAFFLAFTLVVSSGAVAFATTYLSMATGSPSGVYYPVGRAIGGLITKYLQNVVVNVEVSTASVSNCEAVGKHAVDLALVQNNVATWAYTGRYMFREKAIKNLRAIATLYPEAIQIVTLKGRGINTITDLVGKRVSIGLPGSGTSIDAVSVLRLCGVKMEDLKLYHLSFSETTRRIEDGKIDAGFVTAGYPTASIMNLAAHKNIELVSIPEEMIEKIHLDYPYYVRIVIPKGTYKGLVHDVTTVSCMAMLVVNAALSERLVYDITKTMWEHIKDIYSVHEKAKYITLKTALDGLSIPLHRGAERYYEEKGMLK